jgi:hypothetical protein
MKFSITWTPSARSQLVNLWVQAADRQAITDAADRIDQELSRDPEQKGIEWPPYRVYFEEPLAVLFKVVPDDKRVWIYQVRLTIDEGLQLE